MAEAGDPPGKTGRGRDGAARIDPHLEEPRQDILEQRLLAAEKMGAAGDIEKQPVTAVEGHKGRIAVAPVGDTVEQAAAFQQFLETNVWTSREASPALAGTPRARVLTKVDAGQPQSSS